VRVRRVARRYFVKHNDHLLGDVKVIEVAASEPRFLYGQPI
jgi:hypothetical protein